MYEVGLYRFEACAGGKENEMTIFLKIKLYAAPDLRITPGEGQEPAKAKRATVRAARPPASASARVYKLFRMCARSRA